MIFSSTICTHFRDIKNDRHAGEGHLNALLRGTLLSALAELGHQSTIDEVVCRFNVFLEDRETPLLPPDVRKVSTVIKHKLSIYLYNLANYVESTCLPSYCIVQAAYVALMQTVNKSNKSGYESLLKIYRETDLS